MLIFGRLIEQVQSEKYGKQAKKTKSGKILRPAQNDDWY